MSSPARVVEATHLVTLAALTGLVGLDPTARLRGAPDYAGWLAGQQRLARVMSRVAPPLFLSAAATALGAALVAGTRHRPTLAVYRVVAAGCVAAAVRVTLTVNEPANARLRAWSPDAEPPDGWRSVRARWDEGHRQRRVLVGVAAAAVALGLVVDGRGRRG